MPWGQQEPRRKRRARQQDYSRHPEAFLKAPHLYLGVLTPNNTTDTNCNDSARLQREKSSERPRSASSSREKENRRHSKTLGARPRPATEAKDVTAEPCERRRATGTLHPAQPAPSAPGANLTESEGPDTWACRRPRGHSTAASGHRGGTEAAPRLPGTAKEPHRGAGRGKHAGGSTNSKHCRGRAGQERCRVRCPLSPH